MLRALPQWIALAASLAACSPQANPVGPNGAPSRAGNYDTSYSVAPANAPSGAAVDQFAIAFLDSLQARSIAERREYCGHFFVDGTGQIRATPPEPGTFAGCEMAIPQPGQGIFASYHTHGAFGRTYDNEVPSPLDLVSDFDFGIDGYVSTPGGRIWLIDVQTRTARQLCGLRCVTWDPGFQPIGERTIRQIYTLEGIKARTQ